MYRMYCGLIFPLFNNEMKIHFKNLFGCWNKFSSIYTQIYQNLFCLISFIALVVCCWSLILNKYKFAFGRSFSSTIMWKLVDFSLSIHLSYSLSTIPSSTFPLKKNPQMSTRMLVVFNIQRKGFLFYSKSKHSSILK